MRMPAGGVEIIYVDSNSTDGSRERARELGAKVLELARGRPCAARGRNLGWRTSRGKFVFFLDGDTLVHPEFLEAALTEFSDPRVAIVWGHRREIAPGASLYNRVLDLDWIYAPGPSDFCGGDAVVRRAVLEQVKGFDEELIAGEEPEMCARVREKGHTILHVDRPMTGHDLAIFEWRQYWRRAVRAGHAYAEVSTRFARSALPLWRRESRRNLVHAGLLIGVPAFAVASTIALRSAAPTLVVATLLALVVGRTASRCEWKSAQRGTRVLYAIHSHLQQIPIAFGQLSFFADALLGRRRGLIEYKG
jgi:cellulose synthase/poly-beta-1,6-N-acetylglucosamine synthase-like glycosyltransferase